MPVDSPVRSDGAPLFDAPGPDGFGAIVSRWGVPGDCASAAPALTQAATDSDPIVNNIFDFINPPCWFGTYFLKSLSHDEEKA
jgi:hypothetical protein